NPTAQQSYGNGERRQDRSRCGSAQKIFGVWCSRICVTAPVGIAAVRNDHEPVCAISPPKRRSRRWYSAIALSSAARSKSGQKIGTKTSSLKTACQRGKLA